MQTDTQSLCILGRQPALGRAELESLYGADVIQPIEQIGALVNLHPDEIDFGRLGGSIKLARVFTVLDSVGLKDAETYLLRSLPNALQSLPDGKLQLGLSVYGLRATTSALLATGLNLKKAIKKSGRSVRLVPNKELELNSASVIHNNLTGPTGCEIILIRSGMQTIIAQTVAVQDIDSYTMRDRERPNRDARVGMLPPKLAQIIINLAVAHASHVDEVSLLDPFCGSGVLLQEAALMDINIYGSDIDPRMIEYSDTNLQWLLTLPGNHITVDDPDRKYYKLEVADATDHTWSPIPSVVASETYLGRPFTTLPSTQILHQTASECNLIIKKFLQNIRTQLPRGTRLCLAVPAWHVQRGQFLHLQLLDSLRELGYNRISFEHCRTEDLIYFRTEQIVGRELLLLQKL